MTQTFGTNSDNDIYIGSDGNLAVLSGLSAVGAACKTASQAQLGEMVLAVTSGIPNFGAVWVGAPKIGIFEAYLRRTLLAVNGVTEVSGLNTSVNNGRLQYTATIRSQFGPLALNG